MHDTFSELFDSLTKDFFDFPPVDWKKIVASYPMRFGWYYRSSTKNHEFWWGGTGPVVVVSDAEVLKMPQEIINEIDQAEIAKGKDGQLD